MRAPPAFVDRMPSRGGSVGMENVALGDAGSGDPAYKATRPATVGRVPSRGVDGHLKKMGAVWK